MKKITIVTYRAFDMEHTEVFINKSDAEIKAKLDDTCSTYDVQHTYYGEIMSEHNGGLKSDYIVSSKSGYLSVDNTNEKL